MMMASVKASVSESVRIFLDGRCHSIVVVVVCVCFHLSCPTPLCGYVCSVYIPTRRAEAITSKVSLPVQRFARVLMVLLFCCELVYAHYRGAIV